MASHGAFGRQPAAVVLILVCIVGGAAARGVPAVRVLWQPDYTSGGAASVSTVDTATGKRAETSSIGAVGDVLQNVAAVIGSMVVDNGGDSFFFASLNHTTTEQYVFQVVDGGAAHEVSLSGAGIASLWLPSAADAQSAPNSGGASSGSSSSVVMALLVRQSVPEVAKIDLAAATVTVLLKITEAEAQGYIPEGLATYCAATGTLVFVSSGESNDALVSVDMKAMQVKHIAKLAGSVDIASLVCSDTNGKDSLYAGLQTSGNSQLAQLNVTSGAVVKTLTKKLLPYVAVPAVVVQDSFVAVTLNEAQQPHLTVVSLANGDVVHNSALQYAPMAFL